MRPIFKYKDNFYNYTIVKSKVIPFKIEEKKPEDEFEFDTEMKKQLEMEFTEHESTLSDEELKIWKGKR